MLPAENNRPTAEQSFQETALQHLAEQTKSLETIKTIAVLFTVLFVLGAIFAGVIVANGS